MFEAVTLEGVEFCCVRLTFTNGGFQQIEDGQRLLVGIGLVVAGLDDLLVAGKCKCLGIVLVLDVILQCLQRRDLIENEVFGKEVTEVLVVALAYLTAEDVGLNVAEHRIALGHIGDILEKIEDVRNNGGVFEDEDQEVHPLDTRRPRNLSSSNIWIDVVVI